MVLTGIDPRASFEWHRIPAHERHSFHAAMSVSPAALCVVQCNVTPLSTWTPHTNSETWTQDRIAHFDVRHLERLPATGQIEYVAAILARDPLAESCAFAIGFAIEQQPIADAFYREVRPRPTFTRITPNGATARDGAGWTTSGEALAREMDVRLERGELRFAADLPALTGELKLAVQLALFGACRRSETSWEPLRF